MVGRHTQKVLLAVGCCLVLVLLPLSTGWAQGGVVKGAETGIKKGAQEVKNGAEYVGEKTKEGAEAVGKGAKDLVTDDDKDTKKGETTTTGRMKPATGSQSATSSSGSTSTSNRAAGTGESKLPATAGELPLLALAGAIALLGAGALRVVRKTP